MAAMLQNHTASCLGSVPAGAARQLAHTRPCPRMLTRRAATVVPQALNRTEFSKEVQAKTAQLKSKTAQQLSSSEVEEVVRVMLETITDVVARGESITITGFGKFEPR